MCHEWATRGYFNYPPTPQRGRGDQARLKPPPTEENAMRIEEELEKTGFFWLPNCENNKKPGTLRITKGGEIELEIIGNFDDCFKQPHNEWNIPRIVGSIEGNGDITLEDCIYKKKNYPLGGGISKSEIHVSLALSGAIWEENEPITFSTLSFSVDCLDEWVGISGINVQHDFESRTTQVSYTPPSTISIALDDTFTLEICFNWTVPNTCDRTEAKIVQNACFKLTSQEARPLTDFTETAFKITNLMCLAMDDTISMKRLVATSPDIATQMSNGQKRPLSIKVYYESQPYSEREPRKTGHDMIFTYKAMSHHADKFFNKWLAAYETLSPAMSLYFSVKTNAHQYIDGKFLALAQGLETYHRRTSDKTLMETSQYEDVTKKIIKECPKEHQDWLSQRLMYGNELSLRKRLKAIAEPFKNYLGSNAEREKLLRLILTTRNYLTHYSIELEEEAAKERDLWAICQKMEALFSLHLLAEIGFTETEIQTIVNSSQTLKRKLKAQ